MINLKLENGRGKYDENQIVMTPEETIFINIEHDLQKELVLFANVKKGKSKDCVKVENSHLILPQKYAGAGVVEITIDAYYKDKALKRFVVERLIIKEVDGSFLASGEIENLRNRVFKIENALAEINEIIKNNGSLKL